MRLMALFRLWWLPMAKDELTDMPTENYYLILLQKKHNNLNAMSFESPA
jgi:hypothetical protein